MDRTVVVGGGISGLSLGHALLAKGREVRVLEASARAGGSVQSVEKDGFLLECGPHGFLDVEPAMRALVDALGLAGELRPADAAAKRRYLFSGGRLEALPSSPPAFLRSGFLPWSTKLRVLLEPLSRRGVAEDESLADFSRRHLGARATAILVDAAQSGIYAGDVERLSARATFPKLWAMEREHRSLVLAMIRRRRAKPAPAPTGTGRLTSFRRGLSTLTDALAAKLGDRLTLNAKVERIEKTPQGYRVHGGGETLEAERLVLATPARLAAALLEPLSQPLGTALGELHTAPLSVVHLAYPHADLPRPLDGFGFLAPSGEGRRVLGAIFVSTLFPERARPGHAQLAVMVGGARGRAVAALDPPQLAAVAHDELCAILGVRGAPVLNHVVQWPHALPQYQVGHLQRLERIDRLVGELPGLHLTGNAYRGVGLNDCVRSSNELAARL
jgi:oxygen-dependent protoporphyrinogen oxidase